MIAKTSIRFFNSVPVRARWSDEDKNWWYAATDVVQALVGSKNARRYWNTFKSRHMELSSFCRQLKLTAADGKQPYKPEKCPASYFGSWSDFIYFDIYTITCYCKRRKEEYDL